LEENIKPQIKEAKAGERILLFADASHFVFGSFWEYLWRAIRILFPQCRVENVIMRLEQPRHLPTIYNILKT
jgi:hypothetical protein